jgi:subtilisin-like proprotein convertase family protein
MYNINESIPDNDVMGVQNTQTLSGYTGIVSSVDVSLTLSGDPLAFNGDLFVSLQSANGGYAVLLNRPGRTLSATLGYDNNGFDVILASGGSDIHNYQDFSPVYSGDGSLTGTWSPDGRNVNPVTVLDSDSRTAGLSTFNGIDANGEWTLFAADLNQNGLVTIDSWGLQIATIPEPGTLVFLLIGITMLMLQRFRCLNRNKTEI